VSAKLGEIIMADERNVHVKFAMADVLGLFAISMFTFLVAGLGLGLNGAGAVAAVAFPVGIATLIAAYMAYVNENLLGTAIFGPLGVFFLGFVAAHTLGGEDAMMVCVLIGIIILIDAIVAFAQPVKLLPILLLIAAVAFFVTAMFYNSPSDGMMTAFGALWMIYSLLSFYMAAAIMMLVMKGKPVLPLLISK
jgi:succinate-acetate transporter protein